MKYLQTLGFFLLAIIITVLVFVFGAITILLQVFRHLILDNKNLNNYFYAVILGGDSFAGSVVYGKRGEPFYLSSIAYYDATVNNKNIWFMFLINALFFNKEHCKDSYCDEVVGKGIIPKIDSYGNYERGDI